MLTELKELTEQKSPNLNKQRAHVWHRLPQAGQADSGGVVTVTKSTININAKVFLSRFSIIHFFFFTPMAYQSGTHNPSMHIRGLVLFSILASGGED